MKWINCPPLSYEIKLLPFLNSFSNNPRHAGYHVESFYFILFLIRLLYLP